MYVYLFEAAIPFFKLDKLDMYTGTIDNYSNKRINNCIEIANFYKKVMENNQVDFNSHLDESVRHGVLNSYRLSEKTSIERTM